METRHLFTMTLQVTKPDYVGKAPAVERRVTLPEWIRPMLASWAASSR